MSALSGTLTQPIPALPADVGSMYGEPFAPKTVILPDGSLHYTIPALPAAAAAAAAAVGSMFHRFPPMANTPFGTTSGQLHQHLDSSPRQRFEQGHLLRHMHSTMTALPPMQHHTVQAVMEADVDSEAMDGGGAGSEDEKSEDENSGEEQSIMDQETKEACDSIATAYKDEEEEAVGVLEMSGEGEGFEEQLQHREYDRLHPGRQHEIPKFGSNREEQTSSNGESNGESVKRREPEAANPVNRGEKRGTGKLPRTKKDWILNRERFDSTGFNSEDSNL